MRDGFYDSKAYLHYKALAEAHNSANPKCATITENLLPNLSGHTLAGAGKIELRTPSLFLVDDQYMALPADFDLVPESAHNVAYTFLYLGDMLSGHLKIVHGGLLATLLDELTCRVAFQNWASGRGVTANLNIAYKKPCPTDLYVMIKCSVIKKLGRKCWTKGEVFKVDLDSADVESKDSLLTECECLVVEPHWEFKDSH